MALEEIIAANTAAVEKQTAILEKLLSQGQQAVAAKNAAPATETTAPAAEDKPKTTAKPKADAKPKTEAATETAAVTVETLTAKFKPWLGEFASDHPETAARKAKFKEVLGKLGAAKLSEIEDAAKLAKLDKWFEEKAKTNDEGHGVGRFAADPAPDGEEEGGDDDL